MAARPKDLELLAAYKHASRNDGRFEHPWYGVWMIVLRKLCKIQTSSKEESYIVPVIYPQDPVAHLHVDLHRLRSLRTAVAPSPPSPGTRHLGAISQGYSLSFFPSTPTPNQALRSPTLGSPLTVISKAKRKRKNSEDANFASSEDDAYPDDDNDPQSATPPVPAPGANRNLDSTRFPDFSRVISHFYPLGGDTPLEIRDLIVENKPRSPLDNTVPPLTVANDLVQTRDQAWHTFQSDKSVNAIGCILAYGELWMYHKYKREVILGLYPVTPAPTRGDDDDYVDSGDEGPSKRPPRETRPPQTESSPIIPKTAVEEEISRLLGRKPWLNINTEESDHMLTLIEKRLRELNKNFWAQVTP